MTVSNPAAATHERSKTIATWLALLGGTLGLHRFYLHGFGDKLGWLHAPLSAVGLLGVLRMRELGQDDHLAWLLIPVIGAMISQAMLCAIVYGLTPDEKWAAKHNPGQAATPTAWGPVLAVVAALLVGGAVLMGTIAFSIQKFFEVQVAAERAAEQDTKGPR